MMMLKESEEKGGEKMHMEGGEMVMGRRGFCRRRRRKKTGERVSWEKV